MDALGRKACGTARTVKPCGPDPPTLGSSRRIDEPERWGLKSPVPQGERGVSRKAIAQGVPCDFGLPDDLWAFSFSAHEDCGCGRAPGTPCALRFPRAAELQDSDARSRRGNAFCCLLGAIPPSAQLGTGNRRRPRWKRMATRPTRPSLPSAALLSCRQQQGKKRHEGTRGRRRPRRQGRADLRRRRRRRRHRQRPRGGDPAGARRHQGGGRRPRP